LALCVLGQSPRLSALQLSSFADVKESCRLERSFESIPWGHLWGALSAATHTWSVLRRRPLAFFRDLIGGRKAVPPRGVSARAFPLLRSLPFDELRLFYKVIFIPLRWEAQGKDTAVLSFYRKRSSDPGKQWCVRAGGKSITPGIRRGRFPSGLRCGMAVWPGAVSALSDPPFP